MVVSVDGSGAPLLSTMRQSLAHEVEIGQHVLVKAGESVSSFAFSNCADSSD